MIQRFLLLTGTFAAFFCGPVFGLGLGNLELHSALNQEFGADISLTNTRGLAIEEVLPNLASQQDFDRVGVERTYLLTDLRFKVVRADDGTLSIKVFSNRPIVEPFLNFVVEVLWPGGRILREYTVLLDPPVFANRNVAPVAASQTTARERTSRQSSQQSPRVRIPRETSRPSQAPARRDAVSQEGDVAGDEYGMTGPGDTLWTIAMKVRPDSSVSIQQTMLALQAANPDAFINNNINLLKAGHVLRIPDRSEIRRASASEAVAEVRSQNQEFQEIRGSRTGRGVAQLDATRRSSAGSSSGGRRDEGELKLLAANRGSGQRAGDADSRSIALENDLAVAREDLDRARRANTEISVRMDDLAGQVETLNKLVELKNDQLAALRNQVEKSLEAGPAPVAGPAKATSQDSLLSNPMVLGALGLLALGGVIGGMILMRRRRQNTSENEEDFAEVSIDEEETASDDADEEKDRVAEEEEEAEEEEDEEELSPQTTDVISEAEIYIAYGRFPQAITFLQNAISAEPDRADIQLKLLEVYVQTEDATAFNLQFDELKTLRDAESIEQGQALQSQIPGASENAEAAMEATIISSEPIIAIDDLDDDDDLSFDLDDLDSDTGGDDLDDELDLDDAEELDLDLDLSGDELSLDDEDDGGIDKDATLELETPVAESEDDFELELDLDDVEDLSRAETLVLDEGDELDLEADDLEGSDLEGDELEIDLGDDDLELDLGDGELDLDADLNLDEDLEAAADETEASDENEITLDMDKDLELDGDLELDEELELDLEDDGLDRIDDLELNLDGDDLDLDDDDLGELNLDEDASTKLDLARAYIDMGDNDGAKTLLKEVLAEGAESDIAEANEMMEKLD